MTDAVLQNSEAEVSTTHYRVPRGDGQFLIEPALSFTPNLISENQSLLNNPDVQIWEKTLSQWRTEARRELVERKSCHCADHGSLISKLWILTGHQPELIHPGVLIKNMLVDYVAKLVGGVGMHVTIDSDTVKSRRISIPTEKNESLTKQQIVVDNWPIGIPWQEIGIRNRQLFDSFPERVQARLSPLKQPNVVDAYWQSVSKHVKSSGDIVDGLIAGRQSVERELGISNQELRLTDLAETDSFHSFLAHIICDARKFCSAYNQALASYRERYGLKNNSHPMPDLILKEHEIELPFWIWSAEHPQRHGLYLLWQNENWTLTNHAGWSLKLPAQSTCTSESLQVVLQEISSQGFRIRTRALITTLYMRLFLADWFIHGIGGAKYDEVTDEIIRLYFQMKPPHFQVASGTVWLPLQNVPVTGEDEISELKQKLRRAEQNPETILSEEQQSDARDLLLEKQELISEQKAASTTGLSRRERRLRTPENQKRYYRFEEIREQLLKLASEPIQQLDKQLEQAEHLAKQRAVATDREYPFCLYPLETLQKMQEKFNQITEQ
ncbi:hypothetical protein Pan54_18500 [Rubinisphaera italica]|uniref:Uncharacterized protein n=2 Tax=Rubinisphaera italica TaxID=2527969 RepID=A0A5C5XG09_9PLAN|nr:hypothetical protein Pan54_18500 [Rubinisphaera italica]